nr:DUF2155 domain-containing protein [Acetobacter conturbans]
MKGAFAAGAFLLTQGRGFAAEPLAPPAMYPANTWQGKSTAVVRVLNRLDSRVETLTLPVGSAGHYETLDITVNRCLVHAPTLRRDTAAWVDVQDKREAGAVFHGWMLAEEPSLGIFESPIYDIRVVTCEGDNVAPTPLPLQAPVVPSLPGSSEASPAGTPTAPSDDSQKGAPSQAAPEGGTVPDSGEGQPDSQ